MTMQTLARDDFAKLLFNQDFFEANPAFVPMQETITSCRDAYRASAKNRSCGCGADPRLLFDCLDATLAFMEGLRTENPEALQTLIAYLARVRNKPAIRGFTLYYRKTAKEPLIKVRFP